MKNIEILNVRIMSISLCELLRDLKSGVLFTPNVDHLIQLQKDLEFYKAYKGADWIICDSNILNLAAGVLGSKFKEVIPGSSFFPAFYTHHRDNKSIKIFLLGAAEGVAEKAKLNINSKVGWEMIVETFSPKFGFENDPIYCDNLVHMINESGANVLVVGLGAPKQEKWIMKHKDKLTNVKITMALGATIDFEAGHIKRAPLVYRKLHLEWLYRLLKEPKRLWKRYLVEDLAFFKYVLQQKSRQYKNPFEHL